jgi:hypothetical protein
VNDREQNDAKLIEFLEQIIADVRKYGAVDARWEIDAEDCGRIPFHYRLDTVIDRGVPVTRTRPFWKTAST